jgi:hypothetical protein
MLFDMLRYLIEFLSCVFLHDYIGISGLLEDSPIIDAWLTLGGR